MKFSLELGWIAIDDNNSKQGLNFSLLLFLQVDQSSLLVALDFMFLHCSSSSITYHSWKIRTELSRKCWDFEIPSINLKRERENKCRHSMCHRRWYRCFVDYPTNLSSLLQSSCLGVQFSYHTLISRLTFWYLHCVNRFLNSSKPSIQAHETASVEQVSPLPVQDSDVHIIFLIILELFRAISCVKHKAHDRLACPWWRNIKHFVWFSSPSQLSPFAAIYLPIFPIHRSDPLAPTASFAWRTSSRCRDSMVEVTENSWAIRRDACRHEVMNRPRWNQTMAHTTPSALMASPVTSTKYENYKDKTCLREKRCTGSMSDSRRSGSCTPS